MEIPSINAYARPDERGSAEWNTFNVVRRDRTDSYHVSVRKSHLIGSNVFERVNRTLRPYELRRIT